jgi:hypothetical protein
VHVSAILQKLKVYSRTQAAVLAGRLLSSDPLRDIDMRYGAGRGLGRHERQAN